MNPSQEHAHALACAELTEPWIRALACHIHTLNHHWWHDEAGNRLERNKGELLCLVHSEISEALEGARKNKMDDHLPTRKAEEVELADALIRLLDYAKAYGFDIAGAVSEKLAYNAKRADHTYAARAAEGGKKF